MIIGIRKRFGHYAGYLFVAGLVVGKFFSYLPSMNGHNAHTLPANYAAIKKASKALGFSMASDELTGSLLKTLACSKPSGRFLELGTGTGLATSWILAGMDQYSTLESVDNDANVLAVARTFLEDSRLELIEADCGEWLIDNHAEQYDFIFADTWHGKYLMLDIVMTMLKPGGLYIIDDMLPQENWPEGHQEKATKLLDTLNNLPDLVTTRLDWSTGLMVCAKKA